MNCLHLYIICIYLCKYPIINLISISYISLVYFCKSSCIGKKAKVNVLNLAFFSLGWTPESSQMQTRYNGLKMPFRAFPISSPLHSF